MLCAYRGAWLVVYFCLINTNYSRWFSFPFNNVYFSSSYLTTSLLTQLIMLFLQFTVTLSFLQFSQNIFLNMCSFYQDWHGFNKFW